MNAINNIIEKIVQRIGERRTKLLYVLIVMFVVNLVCFKGVYYGHDIGFQTSRIQSICECLKSGVFPALIYPNYLNGYGYGNGIFYPDLFLYIPALFMVAGLKLAYAYRLFLVIINMFSFFSMYICIKKILRNKNIATICASLFVMSPYFITDEYIRSALGEQLAFSFLPLFMLGIYKILNEEDDGGIYFSISICGIVYSHILSIFVLLLLFAFIVLFNFKKVFSNRKVFILFFKYGLISVLISAYMLLPLIEALEYDQYLFQNRVQNISISAVPFICLFINYHIFDYDVNRSFIPIPSGILISYYLYLCKKKISHRKESFFFCCLFISIIFFFACSDIFPWEKITFLNVIQFPWRLYQPCTVCFIVGISYFLKKIVEEKQQIIKLFISTLVIGAFTFICFLIMYVVNPETFIGKHLVPNYSVGNGEYIPISDVCIQDKKEEEEFVKSRGIIITSNNDFYLSYNKSVNCMEIEYANNCFENSYIDLPLIYYKGYVALENDKKLDLVKSNEGLVRVYLDDVSGTINVYYGFTAIRKISCIITFAAIVYLIYDERHRKHEIVSNRC